MEIGVTTGRWIQPDPRQRIEAVLAWGRLGLAKPDVCSVNVHELGWVEVCNAAASVGIGVELGVWTSGDAVTLRQKRHPAGDDAGARRVHRDGPRHRRRRVGPHPAGAGQAAGAGAAARRGGRRLAGAGVRAAHEAWTPASASRTCSSGPTAGSPPATTTSCEPRRPSGSDAADEAARCPPRGCARVSWPRLCNGMRVRRGVGQGVAIRRTAQYRQVHGAVAGDRQPGGGAGARRREPAHHTAAARRPAGHAQPRSGRPPSRRPGRGGAPGDRRHHHAAAAHRSAAAASPARPVRRRRRPARRRVALAHVLGDVAAGRPAARRHRHRAPGRDRVDALAHAHAAWAPCCDSDHRRASSCCPSRCRRSCCSSPPAAASPP